jgi:hypothetical protein
MIETMQKVVTTEIIRLDRNSMEYKQVMSEFIRIEKKEYDEVTANQKFEEVNEEFANGTKTIYTFDDGLVRNVIQLNFLSPTQRKDGTYSNHIQNWSLIACEEEDGNVVLMQTIELSILCMHEGGH